MFKKQQKWIALLVTIAFVWLLQVSVMPLAAANKDEKVGSISFEPAPGFMEQEGPEWDRARGKNAALIIVVGFFALSLLYLIIHGINIDATPGTAAYSLPRVQGSGSRVQGRLERKE